MSIPFRPIRHSGSGARVASGLAALVFPSALVAVAAPLVQAQPAPVVYRCPGPPVLYTDTLSPQEARSRNCKPLTDLPVAVAPPSLPKPQAQPPAAAVAPGAQAPQSAPAAVAQPPATAMATALPEARVRPDDQRSRDAEARRILEAELRREEARLSDALKATGAAKPGERVGAEAAQIRRAESDIEAIRRELGRLR